MSMLQLFLVEKFESQEKILGVIESGNGFGDFTEEGFREANAKAVDDCQLIKIRRKTYDNLLHAKMKSQSNERY